MNFWRNGRIQPAAEQSFAKTEAGKAHLGIGDLQGTGGDGLGEHLALRRHHGHRLVQGSTCAKQSTRGGSNTPRVPAALQPLPSAYLARQVSCCPCPWPGLPGAAWPRAPRCPWGCWRVEAALPGSSAASPAQKEQKIRQQQFLLGKVRIWFVVFFSPRKIFQFVATAKKKGKIRIYAPIEHRPQTCFLFPLKNERD